ncbi:hypothetical protein ACQR09_04880 [Bradyrhizobium oligotrophicum]|uniref:hypothetical protein n=1 Tax=Bradyrhizobium oligotrophicum TaxID=44255 RepID=UPI003EBE377F
MFIPLDEDNLVSVNEKGNLRPDGISLELPFIGWGGAYYWNPGAPAAPSVTLTRGVGMGGGGAHLIHLRRGMTSEDTLGYGASVNMPSLNVNATIPDTYGIPEPWNAKVSSIGAGVAIPGFGANYTVAPARIAEFIKKYILGVRSEKPASASMPTFQSGRIRTEPASEPPVPYAGSSLNRNDFGSRIAPWASGYPGGRDEPSAGTVSRNEADRAFSAGASAIPYIRDAARASAAGFPGVGESPSRGGTVASGQAGTPVGGLLGMIQDYLLTEASRGESR